MRPARAVPSCSLPRPGPMAFLERKPGDYSARPTRRHRRFLPFSTGMKRLLRPRGRRELVLECVGVELEPISDAELLVDRRQVVAQRVLTDVELLGHRSAR